MDLEASGIILLSFTSYNSAIPLQLGQAPLGELKEKLLGSGLG